MTAEVLGLVLCEGLFFVRPLYSTSWLAKNPLGFLLVVLSFN